MNYWRPVLIISLAVWISGGCRQEQSVPPQPKPLHTTQVPDLHSDVTTHAKFEDVANQLGIDFTARNGEEQKNYSILETLGVGVAWIDFDQDGQLDLFVPGGGSFSSEPRVIGLPGELFWQRAGRFVRAGTQAGLADESLYSHAAIVGDYDNDGFRDLLITGYGGVRLFHNCGDGTFLEISNQSGLDCHAWSTGAAWGDLNGDGNLDLYVVNYLDWSFANHPRCMRGERSICAPIQFAGLPDQLFLSQGDGSFLEMQLPETLDGKGLAVVAADVDLDGDLDLYVANDTTQNFLLQNNGQAGLHDIGIESGTALGDSGAADGSMGVDVGDFNLDGLPDLWVANFEGQSFGLYENLGNCIFQHASDARGISAVGGVYVGFGTAFFDFDCDGDEDLFTANGHVTPSAINSPFQQVPLLFENIAGKRFVKVHAPANSYLASPHMGRGVAMGDVDGDGDLDIAIAHTNQPLALLRNDSCNSPNWLAIQLVGRASNRDATGSRVIVSSNEGKQSRYLKGGSSYLSSHDHRVYFGFPKALEQATVEIYWASGQVQNIESASLNRQILVVEP